MSAPAPVLTLNDGNTIPCIGLGTWPMGNAELARVIPVAVDAGYRHFDSAVNYGNEVGVGEGLRNSSVGREELFVTTKVPGRDHGYDSTVNSVRGSLGRTGLDHLDLVLIHWPNPRIDKYGETWRALVDLQRQGLVRSIGVSNFKPHHVDRIVDETGVTPAVNQIQLFPGVNQEVARAYADRHGIVIESWSPLGLGATTKYYNAHAVVDAPLVVDMAAKYEKTPGQIVLRWHVQLGLVPLPKSANAQRLADNIAIFDFELEDNDMTALAQLDSSATVPADSDDHEEL